MHLRLLLCVSISTVTQNVSSSTSLLNVTKNSGVTARKKCEERTAITKGINPHQENGNIQIPEVILQEKS